MLDPRQFNDLDVAEGGAEPRQRGLCRKSTVGHREVTKTEDFHHRPDVAMGTTFRSPGLRTSGKIFAFLGSGISGKPQLSEGPF
jgi:hypothetical protein